MFSSEELLSLKKNIISYRDAKNLPSEKELSQILDSALSALETESEQYRPLAEDGKPGGLLDFKNFNVPVIVVPDLHARADFLVNLLDCTLGGESILSSLNNGKVIIVCVGDGVHTENTVWAASRWKQSLLYWSQKGVIDSETMNAEMLEGFATMMTVWKLKSAFPKNFHFLKGNHENILNCEGGGNHPFRKFAYEGEMVKNYVDTVYGDVILHLIHCFETLLPIVAVFNSFGISHAEPYTSYSKEEIINYHNDDSLIEHFTWTANDEAQDGSVKAQLVKLGGIKATEKALWFGGHRPVEGLCFLRQNGQYIQIHNPNEMNVAVIFPERKFDYNKDIISVKRK